MNKLAIMLITCICAANLAAQTSAVYDSTQGLLFKWFKHEEPVVSSLYIEKSKGGRLIYMTSDTSYVVRGDAVMDTALCFVTAIDTAYNESGPSDTVWVYYIQYIPEPVPFEPLVFDPAELEKLHLDGCQLKTDGFWMWGATRPQASFWMNIDFTESGDFAFKFKGFNRLGTGNLVVNIDGVGSEPITMPKEKDGAGVKMDIRNISQGVHRVFVWTNSNVCLESFEIRKASADTEPPAKQRGFLVEVIKL